MRWPAADDRRLYLVLQMLREGAQLANQHAGHAFHLRCLSADFIAGNGGAGGDLINGAGEFGGGILEALFKPDKGGLGAVDHAIQILRVDFKARQQGG